MPYQIIDPVMAQSIQADTARTHPLYAWVVMQDVPEFPGAYVAQLVTDAPTDYVMVGYPLAELHAQLPPGLERTERQPVDPPNVVEIWFPQG